jgi:organic hydroperoxide reductase OsmC/OhrA
MTTTAFRYPVSIEWLHGRLTRADAPEKPTLEVATPPEFRHGIAGVWSPEDLVVAAASACFAVTLLAVAERRRVPVHALRVDGEGALGRLGDGSLGFVSVDLRVELETDEASLGEARRAAADAENGCLVTSALAVPVHVDVAVTAARRIAA